jgi:GNAT superfamily N-acetyltransferase
MEIRQVHQYTEIMFAFPPKARWFAETEAAGGAIFCAYASGTPVGFVCLKKQQGNFDTVYLYVNEPYRRKGVATKLTEHAAAYAEKENAALQLRVLSNNPFVSALEKIALSLQMRRSQEMTFFRLDVNEHSKKQWEDYRPKIMGFVERAERKLGNSSIIPFAEADDALLDKVRAMIGKELPLLDPFALQGLNPHFSLIITHNGEIVAINAVRTFGRKMVYEISAAQKGKTIIAGVPVFFDKLFASDTETVTCMVHNDNAEGLNHAKGRFGFLFKESGGQTVYVK